MAWLLWKPVQWFLNELNIALPSDPTILLLGIYPEEVKTGVQMKTCTENFIAALFSIAKGWKQPECPSIDERINTILYSFTMEYYLVI